MIGPSLRSLVRRVRLPSAPRVFLPGFSVPHPRPVHVVHALSWQFDRDGRLVWVEDDWAHNILHDEGEQYILSAAFDTDLTGFGAAPANLYLGIDGRNTLAEDDTLTTVNAAGEPSGNGYARQAISTASGFTLSEPAEAYQAATGTIQFTANGGNWGTFDNRFLTTASSGTSGKLIASLAFSTARTINDGDTLSTTLVIALSE